MASTLLEDSNSISRADEYIRKAEEAEARAKAANTPAAKQSYMATAANWRRLARYLDPTWMQS